MHISSQLAFYRYVSDGSAYDEILKQSRKVQPRGFYAKLMEAPCDWEIYLLLRVMKRAGEVGTVWTARSGKPMATLKRPDGSIGSYTF